jgi:hypothetical protein
VHLVTALGNLTKGSKHSRHLVEWHEWIVTGHDDLRWGAGPNRVLWVVCIWLEILGGVSQPRFGQIVVGIDVA